MFAAKISRVREKIPIEHSNQGPVLPKIMQGLCHVKAIPRIVRKMHFSGKISVETSCQVMGKNTN
jgi:hypothetical protein